MNIYLDIDGTLIDKTGKPAKYLYEFLSYVLDKHDVYWLTTHCRGENRAVEHIMHFLPNEFRQLVERIKPVSWDMMKTEAIDFDNDFRWLDDSLMSAENQDLIDLGCLSKHFLVDLNKSQEIFNPNSLEFANFFNDNIKQQK